MRTPMKPALHQEDRSQLERWIKRRVTPAKVKARARVVLMRGITAPPVDKAGGCIRMGRSLKLGI